MLLLLALHVLTVTGIIFQCRYIDQDLIHNNDVSKVFATDVYGCNAKILTYGLENDHLTDVDEDHLKGRTNDDVKVLAIDSQPYDKVPKDITNFFPNIETLLIQDCQMTNISNIDLKPFTKLKQLSLYSNSLEAIESNLFEFVPDVVYINFRMNPIKYVGTDILLTLLNLRTASFDRNECIAKEVWESPEEIQTLQKLLKVHCQPAPWMLRKEEEREKRKRWHREMTYTEN